MIIVDRLMPQFEAYFDEATGPLDGEFFWPCLPTRTVPWLEAIVGARIYYSNTPSSRSIYPKPFVDDLGRLPAVEPLEGNVWFEKLAEFVGALVRLSGGRFPVATPGAHSPWDIVGAVRPMAKVYVDVYDSPAALMGFAEYYASQWLELMRHLEPLVPAWNGGYVGFFGIWAPQYTLLGGDDTSISVSASKYAEIMLPADRLIADPWRYYMFHAHSVGAHLFEAMYDFLEGGRAISVALDPTGPTLDELLPKLRRIQERHIPLHVHSYDWRDAEILESNLSPRGLALSVGIQGGGRLGD